MSTIGKHQSEPNFGTDNGKRNRAAIRLALFYLIVGEVVCLGVLNLRANEWGMEIKVIKYDRETHHFETRNLGPNVADYGWPAVYRRIRFQGNVNDYSSKTVVSSVPALLLNVGVAVCIVLLTCLILDSIGLRRCSVGVVVGVLFFAATLIALLILAAKTELAA